MIIFFKIMTDLRFEEALEASKEYRKQLSRLTTLNNLIETRTLNQYTTQEEEFELNHLIAMRDTLQKNMTET